MRASPVNCNDEQELTKIVIGPAVKLDQAEQPGKKDEHVQHTVKLRQGGQAELFHEEMNREGGEGC